MQYHLMKTNLLEITFINKKAQTVHGYLKGNVIEFQFEACGDFRFKILNSNLEANYLNRLFQVPYFEVEGREIQATDTCIQVMEKILKKRNEDMDNIVADRDNVEVFFITKGSEGFHTLNAMPSKHVVECVLALTKRDPNMRAALEDVLFQDVMENMRHMMGPLGN